MKNYDWTLALKNMFNYRAFFHWLTEWLYQILGKIFWYESFNVWYNIWITAYLLYIKIYGISHELLIILRKLLIKDLLSIQGSELLLLI
jgi:hypothetical protein